MTSMPQAIPPDHGVPRAFWGEHRQSMSADGYLSLPAQFTEAQFILTKGLDGCLMLAPRDYFASLQAKVRALPLTSRRSRSFRRHLFAHATPVAADSQNRIFIPESLRTYANLTDTVVVIGNDAYLEIWNVEAWEQMSQAVDLMVQEEDWQLEGI